MLAFRTEPRVQCLALVVAQDRATGALVRRVMPVVFPAACFRKGAVGKTYVDSQGSYHWITVHPHGKAEPGQPVKVRESKTEPGTWHIVAGAGGKLNYLRLHLGSVEDIQKRAAEGRKARKAQKEEKTQLRISARKQMSEEEQKEEAEKNRARTERLKAAHDELRTRRQEQIAAIAKQLGWADEEWKFDATKERLQKSGAESARILQQEAAHHARVYQKAQDALAATKRQLLADPEQARAILGDLPVTTQDPEKIGLTDLLEPPKTPTGKGFQSTTKPTSDTEIRAAVAQADVTRLREDLEEAEEHAHAAEDDGSRTEAVGRLKDLRGELHMAELLQQAATMKPAEVEAARTAVTEATAAVKAEQQAYQARLGELRTAYRGENEKAGAKVPEELVVLEDRFRTDTVRLTTLKAKAVDLAVIAGESVAPALGGEKAAVQSRKRADKEREIRAEHGDAGVQAYRALVEKMAEGAARYRAEIAHYKAVGALKPPELATTPVLDPRAALELLARQKALGAMERKLQQATADPEAVVDERLFGKGYFTETGKPSAEMVERAKKDMEGSIAERLTRAFLEKAESPELLLGRGGVFTEDLDRPSLHRALERDVGAGAFNALNTASLAAFKQGVLPREVTDVLGAAGGAQLLASLIHAREGSAVARRMSAGLGDYHLAQNVEQAEERLREMEEGLDRADEALKSLTSPSDVTVAVAANEKRQAELAKARQTIGQALGEYEATAALVQALGEKPRTEIQANLGPIDTETAVRQLRALGLGRADYEIKSDGTNYFATVRQSGFEKLATTPDPAQAKMASEVMAIKQGARDEADWEPKGGIHRAATTFTDKALEPPALAAGLKPFSAIHTAADVQEHVARRAADGEDLNTILTDLHAHISEVPAAARQTFAAEVSRLFPLMAPLVEHGKPVLDAQGQPVLRPVKAEVHEAAVQKVVGEYLTRAGLGESAGIAGQQLKMDDSKTHEAMFRALAQDPRAMVAFQPIGELTDQDQRALRHYFAAEVAKVDPKTGVDERGLARELAALGAEPEKERRGLFGPEKTPEWLDWKRARDQVLERTHFQGEAPQTSAWTEYVTALGGTAKAYQALQDRLKSGFLGEFHRAYTVLHNQPLRLGVRDIAHAELHAGFVDPAKREKLLAERRSLLDAARNRAEGKYAAGSALEKMERLARSEEIERQNQMGLLGATRAAATHKTPDTHQRYTLGARAEGQLAALMPNVARHFRAGEPVKLIADKSYAGKYIHQQRWIKSFLAAKRSADAMGTGSGKTSAMIGAFAHAHETPATGVKRGLFVVPSSVQGQFGGEFARFVDPEKITWAANPGGDRTQRLAEHRDQGTSAVVHTHQAVRDDMLRLLGETWGVTPEAARDRFMGLGRKEAADAMRGAWKKHGVDYQMLHVDEGHGLLDRQGKPDSTMSRVFQAMSDITPYFATHSADPIKNDVSELRSLLSKLHPDGRYDDPQDWQRRYGVNTTAATEALQREVAPWIYAAHIPSGQDVRRRREAVPLHPEQQKGYAGVLAAFQQLRAARGKGELDQAAAKVLAPERFQGVTDPKEVERIARDVQRNPGTAKENALRRVVDLAPRATNAKIQKLRALLKDHDLKKQPVVVFAHNLDAVREITEALAEDGHRVESLTGADSAQERDRKRLRFHPERGEAEADVFVLSDAGQAGLNLQRGQTLVQYDRPMTAMGHAQRNGRIDRLGQKQAVDLVDLTTDTPFEARAEERIERKYALRRTLTDPAASLDDTGLAGVFNAARVQAERDGRKAA